MRLKSLIARDMADGMRRVRQLYGEDALIIETEESDLGVRLTIALEREPAAGPVPDLADDDRGGPERIAEALAFHGVPAGLGDRLLGASEAADTDDAAVAFALGIERLLAFRPIRLDRARGALMLVGPPGAGKTVSLAKLAAACVLAGGSVAAITTDVDSAGAVDRLRGMMETIGAPLATAADGADLSARRTEHGPDTLVLIDTPPLDPSDPGELRRLRESAAAAGAETVLVLPGTIAAAEGEEIGRIAAGLGARRLLPTQLDIARRLGGVLAAAAAGGLAFGHAGTARSIGSGLHPLNPLALARILLHAAQPAGGTARVGEAAAWR